MAVKARAGFNPDVDFEALNRRIREVDEQLFAVGLRALEEVGEAEKTGNPILVKTAKMQMDTILEHARGIYMARLFVALKQGSQSNSGPADIENESGTYKMLALIESGIEIVRDGMELGDD